MEEIRQISLFFINSNDGTGRGLEKRGNEEHPKFKIQNSK